MLLYRFSLVLVLIYHSLNALITTERVGPGYFFHSRLSHSACTKCYVDQLWYRTVFGRRTVVLREIEDVLGLYAKNDTYTHELQTVFIPPFMAGDFYFSFTLSSFAFVESTTFSFVPYLCHCSFSLSDWALCILICFLFNFLLHCALLLSALSHLYHFAGRYLVFFLPALM